MITVVMSDQRIRNDADLLKLQTKHKVAFHPPFVHYPETHLLRGEVGRTCSAWAQMEQGTVVTDSDLILNEFRCLVAEGEMEPFRLFVFEGERMTQPVVNKYGRLNTFPRLLTQFDDQIGRLIEAALEKYGKEKIKP